MDTLQYVLLSLFPAVTIASYIGVIKYYFSKIKEGGDIPANIARGSSILCLVEI